VFNKLVCYVKVLSVDVVKSKLLLTHKKSLVNSKMTCISSYSDLQTGMIIEGCVVSIKPSGLVVTFYNNVKVSGTRAAVDSAKSRAGNHVCKLIFEHPFGQIFERLNNVCTDLHIISYSLKLQAMEE